MARPLTVGASRRSTFRRFVQWVAVSGDVHRGGLPRWGVQIFPVLLRRRGERFLVGWVSNDEGPDRVLTAGGRVCVFTDPVNLANVADEVGLGFERDEVPARYDLTRAQRWAHGAGGEVDCSFLLDIWNLAEDVGRSVNKRFDATGRRASRCYDKLFFGCNLSVITPAGHCYVPLWRASELACLRRIIRDATSPVSRSLDHAVRR